VKDSVPSGTVHGGGPLEQRIVELFRERDGEVLSGADIAKSLKVSRTAIWKHMNGLKAQGYRIASLPSRGYRLLASPDSLAAVELAAGLNLKRIARRVYCVRETDSTNQYAFRLADEGMEEGTVVVAESQTAGKGRLGRRWESPFGVNLYCSIILRPPLSPVRASQLTFLSAVAVCRAIDTFTRLKPQLKWPNDILINGSKVAGLLNELNAEMDTVHFVILGIGVNINMRREQFPEGLRHPASSLLIEGGVPVDRSGFARAVLSALDDLYDIYLHQGFSPVKNEWLSRSTVVGRRVRVSFGKEVLEGNVSGIDDDGALLLDRGGAACERVLAGDVTLL